MSAEVIHAKQPVSIDKLIHRLEEPPLSVTANSADDAEILAVVLLITRGERDTLVAALKQFKDAARS